jgi:hypothetical protein
MTDSVLRRLKESRRTGLLVGGPFCETNKDEEMWYGRKIFMRKEVQLCTDNVE